MKPFLSSTGDERGQILILTALALTVLIGMAALTLDVSFMYDKRNRLYAAADAAAKSGAIEVHRNAAVTPAALQAFAEEEVTRHGFKPGAGTTVTVHHGPTSGPFSGNPSYVEVIASEPTSTFFGGLLGLTSMTPTARAVAGSSAGPNCLITLDPPPTVGIAMSNPVGAITAIGCSIADAGGFDVDGTITADSISSATCTSGCGNVTYPSPAPTDPLALLPTPTSADCNNGLPGTPLITVNTPLSLPPGTYNNITFNDGSLTLAPGIYCITGEIKPSSPGKDSIFRDTGGVLIYITPTGTLNLNSNHVDIDLQAMTSGPFSGILFYQDRTNTNDVVLSKNDGPIVVDGALYFPSANVSAKNANFASSNFCGIMVAGSIDWDKPNLTFTNTCTDFGGSPLMSLSLAE